MQKLLFGFCCGMHYYRYEKILDFIIFSKQDIEPLEEA